METADPCPKQSNKTGGEIILRPRGLCNLSEVVIRAEDSISTLFRKVRIATIIGTFQSTLTDFKYVRDQWKQNAEEERLLGVSLTGIMGNQYTGLQENNYTGRDLGVLLEQLKAHAIETNREYANLLGINQSAAITTVKPSGTVSQLVGCSSGIHPAYSKYYIRTVRADGKDPLARFMQDQGVPNEPDVTNPSNLVFSFPQKSGYGATTREQVTAIEQLEHYLQYKKYWCEHNPSITVYVREHEWMTVGAWVYDNFNDIGGVSFLPYSDHIYKQAPYQEISEEQYLQASLDFPNIDWTLFETMGYETEDNTTGTQELACLSGVCEI